MDERAADVFGCYLMRLASALAAGDLHHAWPARCFWSDHRLALAAFAGDYDLPILRGSQPVAARSACNNRRARDLHALERFLCRRRFQLRRRQCRLHRCYGAARGIQPARHGGEQQFTPSQLQLLGRGADTALGFGGFFGYNTPVAGSHPWHRSGLYAHIVERNGAHQLDRPLLSDQYRPPLSIPAGTVTGVNLYNASGHLDLTDYGEVRGRAGFIVGNLLPYGFVGFVADAPTTAYRQRRTRPASR